MSEIDRMGAVADGDRLPWLEAVEDEDRRSGAGAGTLVAALIAALVALGLIVGGVFWLGDRGDPSGGAGELIAAPDGAYKQRPAEPGGMQVEGQGDAAYAASAGTDLNAAIDVAALPETPVTAARVAEPTAPAPAVPVGKTATAALSTTAPGVAPQPTAAAPATAVASAAVPAPAGGGVIQLGAFGSEAKANQAWKAMSGRFAYLQPLTSSVTAVTAGSSTLYRLRASAAGDARTVCGKLKVAGETCVVISN
ncbi:MAG: hypothetical protein JWN59_866 [Sphingomonas bacterium]|jgi:hypothetical protein|nr:hypothetical protein [Sphingomonas bacterium]